MKVDKEFAEALEDGKVAGASVNELFSAPLGGDGAFENEFPALAGIHAAFLQECVNLGDTASIKDSLNPGSGCSGPHNGAVRSLTQQEFQGTENHGFSCAGLACNGCESGRKFPLELLNEC